MKEQRKPSFSGLLGRYFFTPEQMDAFLLPSYLIKLTYRLKIPKVMFIDSPLKKMLVVKATAWATHLNLRFHSSVHWFFFQTSLVGPIQSHGAAHYTEKKEIQHAPISLVPSSLVPFQSSVSFQKWSVADYDLRSFQLSVRLLNKVFRHVVAARLLLNMVVMPVSRVWVSDQIMSCVYPTSALWERTRSRGIRFTKHPPVDRWHRHPKQVTAALTLFFVRRKKQCLQKRATTVKGIL